MKRKLDDDELHDLAHQLAMVDVVLCLVGDDLLDDDLLTLEEIIGYRSGDTITRQNLYSNKQKSNNSNKNNSKSHHSSINHGNDNNRTNGVSTMEDDLYESSHYSPPSSPMSIDGGVTSLNGSTGSVYLKNPFSNGTGEQVKNSSGTNTPKAYSIPSPPIVPNHHLLPPSPPSSPPPINFNDDPNRFTIKGWINNLLKTRQMLFPQTQSNFHTFDRVESNALKNPSHYRENDPLNLIDERKVAILSYLNETIAKTQQLLGITNDLQDSLSSIPVGGDSFEQPEFIDKNLPDSIIDALRIPSKQIAYFLPEGSYGYRPYLPGEVRMVLFNRDREQNNNNNNGNNIKYYNVYCGTILSSPEDPYHVPFTQTEREILKNRITSLNINRKPSTQELFDICQRDLYGRTPIDCKRYLEDVEKGLVTVNNFEYRFKPKQEPFTFQSQLFNNELGKTKNQYKSTKRILGANFCKFKKYYSITLTSSILDTKINPSGVSNQILALSIADSGEALLYDIDTNTTKNLKHDKQCIEGNFSIDGREALTVGQDGAFVVWSTRTGEKLYKKVQSNDEYVRMVTHPQLTLAAGGFKVSKSIMLLNYKSFQSSVIPVNSWPLPVSDLAFGRGNYQNYILCGLGSDSEEGTSKGFCTIIDINKPEYKTDFFKEKGEICSLSWNTREHQRFAVAPTNGIVGLFDFRENLNTAKIQIKTDFLDTNYMSWSPCGEYLAIGGSGNTSVVFDQRATQRPLHTLQHDMVPGVVSAIVSKGVWSSQGNFLFTAGDDGCVRFWDIAKGDPYIRSWKDHTSSCADVDISPSSDLMISGGDDSHVNIYSRKKNYNY